MCIRDRRKRSFKRGYEKSEILILLPTTKTKRM
jgi:hypothetical protein